MSCLEPLIPEWTMELIGRIFAAIGAGGVLMALTFVSLLIGVLIHGMILLMAGKPIDDYLRKKGHEVFEPGNVK
jgi:hypothetical protein